LRFSGLKPKNLGF